eukprot:gene3864-7024_t
MNFETECEEKYVASMVLAAVGDVLGYKNGSWEFCFSGEKIHKELDELGGLKNVKVDDWKYSDDTVMHIATSKALLHSFKTIDEIMTQMAKEYIDCWTDMPGRAAGPTCGYGVRKLKSIKWNEVEYNKSGGGCGGSMRAMCIGLAFPNEKNRDLLISISIESGRLTHNHPTGFLGAMVSAAFTSLALEKVPPKKWGYILLNDLLPRCEKYLESTKRDWKMIKEDMKIFEKQFTNYLKIRGILDGKNDPVFPNEYGIKERDEFYKKWSYAGWGGASGDDSCIIAYDAILGASDNWEELMKRGAFHYGDSDSTGTIAGAWFGALYGFKGVYYNNYENLEKRKEITNLGMKLYQKCWK